MSVKAAASAALRQMQAARLRERFGVARTPATTELLRREGGDDFFEARLAAQGIPERH